MDSETYNVFRALRRINDATLYRIYILHFTRRRQHLIVFTCMLYYSDYVNMQIDYDSTFIFVICILTVSTPFVEKAV